MRTLWELAEIYERWAAEEEALADLMMAGLNSQRKDIHVKQRESAQRFLQEAGRFRQAAARLRAKRGDHGRNVGSRDFLTEIHRVVRMPSQHEIPATDAGGSVPPSFFR
jgi:hypothetical protein